MPNGLMNSFPPLMSSILKGRNRSRGGSWRPAEGVPSSDIASGTRVACGIGVGTVSGTSWGVGDGAGMVSEVGFTIGWGVGVGMDDGVATEAGFKTGVGEFAGSVVGAGLTVGIAVEVDAGVIDGAGPAQAASIAIDPSIKPAENLTLITCIDFNAD